MSNGILNNSNSYTKYFHEIPPQIKSQREIMQQPHFYKLHQINTFLQNDKPKLSQEKLRLIQDKLALDKLAQTNTNIRIKQDNLFIRYSYNPFTDLKQKQMVPLIVPLPQKMPELNEQVDNRDKFKDPQQINIVEAVNNLKITNCLQVSKQFSGKMKQMQKFSAQCIHNVKNYSFPFQKAHTKQNEIKQTVKQTTLQDILNMEDQNFFAKNQQSMNIFQIMNRNQNSILTNRILDKFHFDFTSIIQKTNIMKFPTFRELSRAGRHCITNKPFKSQKRLEMISSYQITVNLEDIKLEHLLSISSGRFTPDICYQTINEGQIKKQMLVNSSQISEAKIIYNQNTNQIMMNYENQKMDRQEIIDYLKLQNTSEEQKYSKKCNRIFDDAKRKISQQSGLLNYRIADQKLHQKLNQQISQDMQLLVGIDNKYSFKADRLVRINKKTKNRRENIKIKKLLDSIVLKNNQQELISQLLNHSQK